MYIYILHICNIYVTIHIYVMIYIIRIIQSRKGYFSFQHSKFSIQMPEWLSYLDCLIKCRMLHIVIFYHMEPLIWVELQFIYSFPLNKKQYYCHFSMTITWQKLNYIMLPSERPSSSTNQWNPSGSNEIYNLNTIGWSNNLFKFSVISWRVILRDFLQNNFKNKQIMVS